MRFKEFFSEDASQKLELQPGYSVFTLPNGNTIQIPTKIRQQYDDNTILDMLKKKGYAVPSPAAVNPPQPGQGAKMTPPGGPSEQPPPGYRFFDLPNGTLTAVPQQLDDKQALDLIRRKRPELLAPKSKTPAKIASATPKKQTRVVIPADLPALPDVDTNLMATAKKTADKFLGRAMTPTEWDHLIRATFAESGHDVREDAYIMGTILNRARSKGFGGTNVSSVLVSPNQFQSVTGVPGGRTQSPHFIQGPPEDHLTKMLQAVVKILPKVPTDIVNFTAANEKAYGKGTDPKFLKKLKKAGGKLIGKTVFGKIG